MCSWIRFKRAWNEKVKKMGWKLIFNDAIKWKMTQNDAVIDAYLFASEMDVDWCHKSTNFCQLTLVLHQLGRCWSSDERSGMDVESTTAHPEKDVPSTEKEKANINNNINEKKMSEIN